MRRASPKDEGARADRRVGVALFLLLAGIYALSAGGHTYSSDEEGMYQTTRSLVERRSPVIEIDDGNDRVTPRTIGRTGAPVGVSGLGQSIVGIPLYLAGTAASSTVADSYTDYTQRVFLGWTNALVTAAGAVLVFLIGRLLGAGLRWAVVLALTYGLGTMVWPHAKTFFSEPLTTTLALAAAYCALRASATGRLPLAAAAGAWAGLALFARSTAGLFLPVIGLYLVFAFPRRWTGRFGGWLRVGAAYSAGAAGPLVLFLASNWWRFGSPTSFGPKSIPLDYPVLEGLYGFLLSPGKSLFLYAPVVLVGLLAVPFAPRAHRAGVTLVLALGFVNLVFFARFLQWHGDHAWGPRYLIMSVPFLALPVAPLLERVKWQRAVLVAAGAGVITAGLGTVMYFNQYFYIVEHTVGSENTPAGPTYWKPMHFDPYWSPVAGTFRVLPDVIRNTIDRADGRDPALQPFPVTVADRYGWYFAPPQTDSWVYWLFPAQGPKKILLLAPVFLGCAAVGAVRLGRQLRPGAQEGTPAAGPSPDTPELSLTA